MTFLRFKNGREIHGRKYIKIIPDFTNDTIQIVSDITEENVVMSVRKWLELQQ